MIGGMKTVTAQDMKKMQFDLLCLLHQFCEESNLRYYLIGGTLIGAVRHKGFIPWDDDIDVVMPRFDYEKFLKTFNQWVPTDTVEMIDIGTTDGYYIASAKLIRKDTILVEKVSNGIPIGVYIDVFCMDNASDCHREAVEIFWKTEFWRRVIDEKNVLNSNGIVWWKGIVHNILKLIFAPISRKAAVERISKVASKHSSPVMTKYVCNYMHPTYGLKEIFLGEWFETRKLAEFEGKQFYIPGGYDPLLRHVYGDYRKLPPVEKQCSHHLYDAYWKNSSKENLEEDE